jgi:Protein of unknown function (DUF3300)
MAMNRIRNVLGARLCSAPLALIAAALAVITGYTGGVAMGQQPPAAPQSAPQSAQIPPDQLDSLVAPIALYPDPLLAQVLAASTYPVEIVQLQQWLAKNQGLKGDALAGAVEKQDWDPSVQGLAAMPDVVKRLADDIQWTTDLGNAFLAQQQDVMNAVQRMRTKAKGNGNLKSTEQQVVETKTVENQQVIVIEQANPQTVYVPTYNPTVVYGPPPYPYPPIYYPPPPPPGSLAISFTFGLMMGAAMGGGWGYGCGWGHNNTVVINNNNNYVRANNARTGNVNGSGNWQHNSAHRGGTPYADRNTASRYGGTARGDSVANRQAGASGQRGGQTGNLAADRSAGGGPGADRSAGGAGAANRAGGTGGGQDHIGSRDLSGGGGRSSSFGGGGDGFSGARASQTSSRGSSSRGGGGRGGGGRRR